MAIFDTYIIVDWSGGSSRTAGRANCIWIAHGARGDEQPACESPASRTEATERVTQLAQQFFRGHDQRRILACFDFGFGYPRGFAAHLPEAQPGQSLWSRVWDYLSAEVRDDLGTGPGRIPTNRSNRFDVANVLNGLIGAPDRPGPFWCVEPNWRKRMDEAGEHVMVPQRMPRDFVSRRGIAIGPYRLTDKRIRSDYPFRLFGNGSVGSQILTGIPRLQQIRHSKQIAGHSACRVWPLETGWATEDDEWLENEVGMVLAEIYPSVRPPLDDFIRDRGQVRAMWHWVQELDADGQLRPRFGRPTNLTDDAEAVARSEEGWVLH